MNGELLYVNDQGIFLILVFVFLYPTISYLLINYFIVSRVLSRKLGLFTIPTKYKACTTFSSCNEKRWETS